MHTGPPKPPTESSLYVILRLVTAVTQFGLRDTNAIKIEIRDFSEWLSVKLLLQNRYNYLSPQPLSMSPNN